ncbi:MAG TPA: tetratricopeptide repeat protein [Longimicrobiales bacterium]
MKSIARLKEQARLHEQKEEWEKAIIAYEQALRLADEEGGGTAELPLFNRIGDLHLRRGRPGDAVRCYEQAADRYAEAGFYSNAIALCNKALRYAPDRAELYRKLGRYSGAQGFLTDARRYFLEYAERKQKAGALAEAFQALEELADLADDAELREMLAKRLEAHGATAEAVQQLRRAYELRLAAGEGEAAEALKRRILELDPGADLSAATGAGSAGKRPGGGADLEAALLPGLELETAAGSAGIEAPAPDLRVAPPPFTSSDDVEGALELPMLDGPDAGSGPPPPLGGDESSTATPALIDVDTIDLTFASPIAGAAVGGDDAGRGASREPPVERLDGADPELRAGLDRAQAAAAAGRVEEAVDALEALRDRLHARDLVEEALALLEELVARSPAAIAAHHLRVELATRAGDRARIVDAYLGLGECLRGSGAAAKAVVVYEQVLAMDPSNELARAALGGSRGAARTGGATRASGPGAGAAADGDGYVDLGALVADDLMEELIGGPAQGGTAALEDADFTELLAQFKAKATVGAEEDDPGSHYDLGLAFKEMGLIDEAIAEFQKALSAGGEQLKIYEELGQCFMLKEQYDVAGKIFSRALKVPRTDDRELLGVYYHLGRCYEELGQRGEARGAFERVVELGGLFRDVAERLARL